MKKPLVLAVICGVIATLFAALYMLSLESTYKKSAEKVKVLVAKKYIDQGTAIIAESVEERSVPKDYIQPRALQSVKELADSDGRSIFITLVPIEKGEQVVTTKLSMLGLDTGISSVIPTGKRAVSIIFDSEEVLGIIKPGNRVDIVSVVDYRTKDGQMQEESLTIMQNVLILSVGKSVLGAAQISASIQKKTLSSEQQEQGRIPISFAVAPAQADALSLVAEKGRIRLSLRPIGDDTIYETKSVKIQDFFKEIAATQPSKEKTDMPEEYLREMQKKQKEALELLKKYQKR